MRFSLNSCCQWTLNMLGFASRLSLWYCHLVTNSIKLTFFLLVRPLESRSLFVCLFRVTVCCFVSLNRYWGIVTRTRSFLETGFWPLYPSFVWFVQLSRTKRVFLSSTRKVLAARSFLVAGFDTNVIPRSFSCRVPGFPRVDRPQTTWRGGSSSSTLWVDLNPLKKKATSS